MKTIKNLLFIILFFSCFSAFAQEKSKLTIEQYNQLWQSETAKDSSLKKETAALEADITRLRAADGNIKVPNCDEDLNKMVGANAADIDKFRRAVNELEGKIGRREATKSDRQKDLDALKSNKIAALPEFFDRVFNRLQALLDGWREEAADNKDVSYTVVKGDCLWFIAKKKDFYGNAFAWPKIYQANRDQIKNPNLIYPKQTFKIPPLNEDEKAKFEKLKKNYKPAPAK